MRRRPSVLRPGAARPAALLAGALLAGALLAPGSARAFFEQTEVGARGVGMGRTFSALADDASAIYWNPAGLAQLRAPEVFLTHNRPYLVPDLALNFATAAYPTRLGTLAVAWSRLSLAETTSEDLFYASAARSHDLGDGRHVALGATVKFAHIGFTGSVATGTGDVPAPDGQTKAAADVGVHVRWSPRLTFGWAVRNLGEPEFDFVAGGGGTSLKVRHEGGLAYRWNPESLIAVALVESGDGGLTPVAGAEIRFYDVFDLRAGVGDLKFYGGVGVRADRLRVDVSFQTHNTLGISTMASVAVPIGGGA